MFSQALGMSLPGTVPASGYAMFQLPLTFVAAKASKPAATREDPRAVKERKREEPPPLLYQPSRGFTLCDFTNQHLLICYEADLPARTVQQWLQRSSPLLRRDCWSPNST